MLVSQRLSQMLRISSQYSAKGGRAERVTWMVSDMDESFFLRQTGRIAPRYRALAIFTHSRMLKNIRGRKIREEYSLKAKGLRMMPEIKRLNTNSTKRP